MCVTRADPASFIQEAATVGPAAFGGETKQEAGGTSGTMPIEHFESVVSPECGVSTAL